MTNTADMAAGYKFDGMDKYRAWDQYIIDMGLKPQINSSEFYSIFQTVTAKPLREYKLPTGYKRTHFDNLLKKHCMMTVNRDGVYDIIWEDGHTGGYPPCYPPEPGRFEEVRND